MTNPNVLWQRVLADLQLTQTAPVFKTWFARTKGVDITNDGLIIGCPNKLTRDQLDTKYRPLLTSLIEQIAGEPLELIFVVEHKAEHQLNSTPLFDQLPTLDAPSTTQLAAPSSAPPTPSAPLSSQLNPNYTLDTFVVGNTNRVAHAAALAITENLAQSYNPFFIYGGTGVGKTHLVQAIGNALLAKNPSLRLLYCSSEGFTNDFIDSLRFKTTNEFKKKYRSVDVLIVDDIQFIGTGNKESTQEEFFHTYNELHDSGRQIILCSDRPPREIASLADRLTSRFEGGLTVDINPPDFETKSAIIRAKAERLQLRLRPDIADYLASMEFDNIRSLEGTLFRLQSLSLASDQPLTLEQVQAVFGQLAPPSQATRRLNPNELLKLICDAYGVTLKDLTGKRRTANLVAPRQLAMYLLRQDIGLNLESIGQLLGGRDHTTVMHGIDKINRLSKSDQHIRDSIAAIRQSQLSH